MPNSLSPLPVAAQQSQISEDSFGRQPIRHRINARIDRIGAQVPTRSKVPARSVTPIY